MTPALVSIPSELFYDGTLVPAAGKQRRQPLQIPMKLINQGFPAALIQVDGQCVQTPSGSRFNLSEAAFITLMIEKLAWAFDAKDLAVICFYKTNSDNSDILISSALFSTVDAAQGKEWSVVLVATTRTQPEEEDHFVGDPRYHIRKLAISKEELMSYHKLPKKYLHYKNNAWAFKIGIRLYQLLGLIKELENRKNISELCLYSRTKFY